MTIFVLISHFIILAEMHKLFIFKHSLLLNLKSKTVGPKTIRSVNVSPKIGSLK